MSRIKNKKLLISLIIICVLIILIILNILIKENKRKNTNIENQKAIEQENQEQEEGELLEELKSVSESERIKIYISKYFKYIENKDYNSAYELLYPEFRNNYFPTIEDYEKYIEEQDYPGLLTIDYNDIYMQGEYYIVTVKIGDMITRSETTKIEKQLIIQENGYNDYYISVKM
ncbi:MAG: hypothetical protein HFJ40_06855 [Clostridia bacterium]|nr:hypothetical protein [Clostridia bacterium]